MIKQLTGQWTSKTSMTQPRSHTPIIPHENKLYIFGGGGPDFKSLQSTAVYDPAADTWRELTPMPTARSGTVGCKVGSKIYIIGGGFKQPNGMFRFLNTVEIYDPATDSWEQGPDMLMPHDYPGGVLFNDYIYILGGHHPDATTSGPKTDPGFDFCERLNLNTLQWEQIAPLPTPRFALSAVNYRGRLLTMGGVAFTPEGFNNFTLIEEYIAESNSWKRLNDLELPWTAAGQGNCVAHDSLFVFGGYSGDGIHSRAAYFCDEQGQWQMLPNIPQPRAAMGMAVMDNTIYLLGGWADDGRSPTDSFYAFEIST